MCEAELHCPIRTLRVYLCLFHLLVSRWTHTLAKTSYKIVIGQHALNVEQKGTRASESFQNCFVTYTNCTTAKPLPHQNGIPHCAPPLPRGSRRPSTETISPPDLSPSCQVQTLFPKGGWDVVTEDCNNLLVFVLQVCVSHKPRNPTSFKE